ncbi:MAG: terminase small subunit [Gammaproteobacteria bacterium]|nr:terminase small subunit [Gammaproteobacteria bacterium]MDP2346819.1 terminase small subunit [Gammaproteobacteria bacterium]
MAKLTAKQESFCLAYIETGSASEAYRQAYNCKAMKPPTISVKASELLANGKITVRLEELRAPVRKRAQISLHQHLDDLKRLRDKAENEGKFSAAVTAEVSRGRASGLYVEQIELTGRDGAAIQVINAEMPADVAATLYKEMLGSS